MVVSIREGATQGCNFGTLLFHLGYAAATRMLPVVLKATNRPRAAKEPEIPGCPYQQTKTPLVQSMPEHSDSEPGRSIRASIVT